MFCNSATGQFGDIADIARFTSSAATTLNAGVQYELPTLSFGKPSARIDYNYLSKRYFNPNPLNSPFNEQLAAAPRGLIDVRLALSQIPLGRADVALAAWGRNVTNKKYKAVGIDFGALGFAGNIYGEPATYGLDLSVKF